MPDLITSPNLENADDVYAALLRAHEGLSEPEMHALNARLILLLANHIGDATVIGQAIAAAGGTGREDEDDPTRA